VKVISNKKNLGVAAAWNQGVKAVNSQWVVILNNDIILPNGWLDCCRLCFSAYMHATRAARMQ